MIRTTLVTLALTAGMVGGTAGVASAHECYVANRSDKGNAGAATSQSWQVLELRDLYANAHVWFAPEGETLPALTEAEIAEALEQATAKGIPLSFTTFKAMIPGYLNKLAHDEFEPTAQSSDGKGVDHFFVAYGEEIIGIYFALITSD